jgi:hypothetical protein
MRKKTNLKARFLTNLVVAVAVLFFSQCKKEDLRFDRDVPMAAKMASGVKLAATGITSSSYYLENALPSGYVKDGSKDYTSYVQAAVIKYSNIVFPGFPIMVNDQGIDIGSNKTLTFQDGSEIRLKPSSLGNYSILRISNSSNVTLYNPVIVGDRFTHTGTSGEWGMGIGIYGSSDVIIHNARVTNCWGDGIYIGQFGAKVNCKNIIIKDSYLRKNRRDGISIIGVDGLLLDNLYSGFNDGTSPYCGINFEPNNSYSELKNIRINNPRTEANRNGIQIGAAHMVGDVNKSIDITIVNHSDSGSPRYPIKIAGNVKSENSGKLYGVIDIINPTFSKTAYETNLYLWLSTNQSNFKTVVSSPEIITMSGSTLSWSDTYESLMKAARGGTVSVLQAAATLTDPISDLISTPVTDNNTNEVVFAVNAGGNSFLGSNGISYGNDRNFSGGSVFRTETAISSTSDDALFQTERYGNFSYNIPLTNGTYEITFRTAEIYHKSSGKRIFNILAEKTSLVSSFDIFSAAGSSFTAYNITKTVQVSDGVLNIDFETEIDNAKISGFHVVRK